MMLAKLIAAAAALVLAAPAAADPGKLPCIRVCMEKYAGEVLTALAHHDAKSLPLAKNARYTENGQAMLFDNGLWQTASNVGAYRHVIADPASGQFGLYATPLLGEQFLVRMRRRYTTHQRVTGTVRLCFADPARADAAVIEAGASLLAYRDTLPRAEAEFLRAARSLLTVLRRGRAYSELIRSVPAPVLLIHGEQDRLVPVEAARRVAAANPGWETEWLAGVGHTPQLEAPDRVVERTVPWVDRLAQPAT